MARTPAQAEKLEKAALANENKSEGMRSLLQAGYEVAQVKDIFGAPYGFVYGVAVRAGLVTPTTREAKPKAAAKAKAPAKATATAKAAAATKAPARAAKAPAKAAAKTSARKATAKA